jgi:DNA-binding protein HU-beta
MNKAELIKMTANSANITQQEAKHSLSYVIEAISTALKQGKTVELSGFGTFKVKDKKERLGVNPRTTEKMLIPACKVPVFKVSEKLKELCNEYK